MLDIKIIRENPEIVKKDLEKRDRKDLIKKLDEVKLLDAKWRESLQVMEKLRHQRNVVSAEIAQLK
jgi:seryl-tRNA synthetase